MCRIALFVKNVRIGRGLMILLAAFALIVVVVSRPWSWPASQRLAAIERAHLRKLQKENRRAFAREQKLRARCPRSFGCKKRRCAPIERQQQIAIAALQKNAENRVRRLVDEYSLRQQELDGQARQQISNVFDSAHSKIASVAERSSQPMRGKNRCVLSGIRGLRDRRTFPDISNPTRAEPFDNFPA